MYPSIKYAKDPLKSSDNPVTQRPDEDDGKTTSLTVPNCHYRLHQKYLFTESQIKDDVLPSPSFDMFSLKSAVSLPMV